MSLKAWVLPSEFLSDMYMAAPGDDILDFEGGQPGDQTGQELARHGPTVQIAEVSKGDTQLII